MLRSRVYRRRASPMNQDAGVSLVLFVRKVRISTDHKKMLTQDLRQLDSRERGKAVRGAPAIDTSERLQSVD